MNTKPRFNLIIPTPTQGFLSLIRSSYAYRRLKNFPDYHFVLPRSERFLEYFEDRKVIPKSKQLLRHFTRTEYDRKFFSNGAEKLNPLIKQIGTNLTKLDNSKYLSVAKQYKLILTRYGPGANVSVDNNVIWLRVNKNGYTSRKNPIHTILHEVIHISIHKDIVKRYKLNHQQKEALVDKLFKYFFKNEYPHYKSHHNLNLTKAKKIKIQEKLPFIT